MLEVCNVEYRVCPPNRDVPYLWLGEAGWRKKGCWPCGIGSLGRRNLCAAAPAAHQDAHGLPLRGRTAVLCAYVCACVCLQLCVCVCACGSMCVYCMCESLCLCVNAYVCLCVFIFAFLAVCQDTCNRILKGSRAHLGLTHKIALHTYLFFHIGTVLASAGNARPCT